MDPADRILGGLAVRGERIAAVGSAEEMRAWAAEHGAARHGEVVAVGAELELHRRVDQVEQGVLALLFDSDGAPIPDDRVGFADHVYRRYYHYGAPFSEEAVERVQTACAQSERCGR